MGRSILSCAAVLLVVCLYFATNQVMCQEGTTSLCLDGMEIGEVRSFKPCHQCECEEFGTSCKACPTGDTPEVPSGCSLEREPGDFPDCCKQTVVCPDDASPWITWRK